MNRRDFIKAGLAVSAMGSVFANSFVWAGSSSSSASASGSAAAALASHPGVSPFHIQIPQSVLNRISRRVADAQMPAPLGTNGWEQAVDGKYLDNLRSFWLNGYNWRSAEAALNRHPQFTAEVDGQTIDFYHAPGKQAPGAPAPKPLLIIHGWPYSRFSLVDVIDRLTDPARFGGDPRQAVTVIAPSLPGHGFSSKPAATPTPTQVAASYHKLMTEVLGYSRFALQGGDHGHVLATYLAHDFPQSVIGLHLSMVPTPPVVKEQQTPDVAAWIDEKDAFIKGAFAYFWLQSGKPASLAYAMADSPVGLAAWFIDKFHAWADLDTTHGDLNLALGNQKDAALGRQRLLTEIMAYLVSDSVASSIWFYQTFRVPGGAPFYPGGRITVPTAAFLPSREFINGRPPRAFAERFFDIKRWTVIDHGAHFPFWEIPDAFAADISAFFATLA